jgi:hypothetical protein
MTCDGVGLACSDLLNTILKQEDVDAKASIKPQE